MNPKLRELLQKRSAMIEEARSLAEEGRIEEARSKKAEVESLNQQIETLRELGDLEAEARNIPPAAPTPNHEKRGEEDKEEEYRSAFIKALRGKSLSSEERQLIEERAMQGGVGEDGGLIIPQDIQTRINEFKRQFVALEQFITNEPVSTRSGSRVLEKLADMVPFAEINELDEIDEISGPKFKPLTYAIKDYAGILPISNTLLADTDQNLMNYVYRWIAKKSITTRNKLILDLLKTLRKEALTDPDDIKTILNVELDPMIAAGAIILTNQDAFNMLDQIKDGDGKYLLQPDPTNPTQKLLFGKRVAVVGNKFLPTTAGKAPVIIGDLEEAIVLFDRQQYSILTTNIGGKAFTRNTTDIRVIEREDVKIFDDEAAIFGELTLV